MEHIKQLSVCERMAAASSKTLCFGDDFFLIDVVRSPLPDGPFKMDTYGFFLCQQGTTQGSIDLIPYKLRAGMLAVNVPEQLITCTSSSDDFSGTCLVMTRRFVEGLGLPYNFSLAIGIRETPVLTLKPGTVKALLNYCDMVRNLLAKERPFQAESLRHLTCAYAYSLGAYLYRMAESRRLSGDERMMQQFLHEVRMHYRKERSVQFYAERLHLTPGYLSTFVKNVSGKTPSEWIDSYVVLEAKALLKSSMLTIQQISNELNFPSQSFFGKFFKRVTGMGPKTYRENKR